MPKNNVSFLFTNRSLWIFLCDHRKNYWCILLMIRFCIFIAFIKICDIVNMSGFCDVFFLDGTLHKQKIYRMTERCFINTRSVCGNSVCLYPTQINFFSVSNIFLILLFVYFLFTFWIEFSHAV